MDESYNLLISKGQNKELIFHLKSCKIIQINGHFYYRNDASLLDYQFDSFVYDSEDNLDESSPFYFIRLNTIDDKITQILVKMDKDDYFILNNVIFN